MAVRNIISSFKTTCCYFESLTETVYKIQYFIQFKIQQVVFNKLRAEVTFDFTVNLSA